MSALLTAPAPPRAVETPAAKLDRLIAEQGVAQTATLERLRKNLEALALSDAEYEEFVRLLHAARHGEASS